MREAVGTAWASVRRWLSRVRSEARRWVRRLRDRWWRSLQLRVITATLVLSAVVVCVLGYFLMQRFVSDLYASKEESARNVAQVGVNFARNSAVFASPPGAQAGADMYTLVKQLTPDGAAPYPGAGTNYGEGGSAFGLVVTLPAGSQGPPVFSGGHEWNIDGTAIVPPALVKAVQAESPTGSLKYLWTRMPVGSSRPVPVLAVGAKFGYQYQLYYFFTLTAEQQSIASIQRTLLLAGIAAVFLLAAIAWLVTRWVVIPVRLASHGARRLSAGHLHERMDVRGTDELAALATSFNEMAASLQEKLAELEDLSQVQRQFVSDVSHELRTPLTTVRLAADVLFTAREDLNPASRPAAELLQSQLERFESLLTDLLEISRYDANAATLDAEPADLGTIIRQSADVAQQLAERRGARIEFRLPAEPCIAEVDRRRVERILRNLLQNAVEHGENKDVVVTAAADSAAVAVSVRDFGVGLRPGEEQLVFERFWRADPARARTSGGTGLGLAIALEDALLHGGWLEAWGEPGRGCVFRLTLPRNAGGELQGSPLPLRPDQAGIDTDQIGLDVTAMLSQAAGAAVGVSADGDGQAAARGPRQDRAARRSAAQGGAGRDGAGQDGAGQDGAGQDSEVAARG
ncbi:MAG TPA: MtrAB system histidine kinase MtrB [Streptosporangiaceae bacterium]|nr:MtrAB system histidine kinase MtrB [Streptosporangiaceae bacterium]